MKLGIMEISKAYLPLARQYNVLFLPSTAYSVKPGITFQEGAFGVFGSVCPMTKLRT